MADKYFTQIKDEIIRSSKLSPHEKAVLSVLLSYGDCGEIYLSQARIAKESNMSRDTVHRIVKSLKSKRYIKTTETADRSTLVYELLTKAVTDKDYKVTAQNDRGYGLKRQGVTAQNDTSNKSISNKTLVIKKTKAKENVLPEWLDKKTWSAWIQFRKELKKPLTPSTIKAQLKKLEKVKGGHVAIINQSIENGWQGLFDLKTQKNVTKPSNFLAAPEGKYDKFD